jgi:hypothetical protein
MDSSGKQRRVYDSLWSFTLRVIASDGMGWEHVAVSLPNRARSQGNNPWQTQILVWSNNMNTPILNGLQVLRFLLLALHSPLL